MPTRPKKGCAKAGCPKVIPGGVRFCPAHQEEFRLRKNEDARRRQNNRGLKTSSAAWKRIRTHQLALHPLCVHCEKEGKITAASHVDHISGNSHDNSSSNLQSLCASCHSKKTVTQDSGFGR